MDRDIHPPARRRGINGQYLERDLATAQPRSRIVAQHGKLHTSRCSWSPGHASPRNFGGGHLDR
jgi:hypothetical protein